MPDLFDAYTRANWAYERLKTLNDTVNRFVEGEAKSLVVQLDRHSPEPAIRVDGILKPLDMAIPVLISEVVFHLRASLDFLVYQLAALDCGGVYQNGTQFPIEHKCAKFNERKETYLKGVSGNHVASIAALQPYKGVDWTARLAALSNEDKHRTFPLTFRTLKIALSPNGPPTPTPQGRVHVNVNYKVTPFIAFANGANVIETLDVLHSQVAETIDLFRPDF